ncbi:MAG TPA: transglycosylase SLT domain-containing protein, partial [Polyangiaceae bacterium]
LRARVAEKQGERALAVRELRWLCLNAVPSAEAQGADSRLAELSSKSALTKQERFARAETLARLGMISDVERELELAGQARGAAIRSADALSIRASAYYAARDYPPAAELFEQAARRGSNAPDRDWLYSARAFSRANQDERALQMYSSLPGRFPKSGLADEALYLQARLRYIQGDSVGAERNYSRFLSRYGKSSPYARQASYEQAVNQLVSSDYRAAAAALHRLIQSEQNPRTSAGYSELYAVALLGMQERREAVLAFRRIMADRPLSFASLASAARLRSLGESVPALIETKEDPMRPEVPLDPELPQKAELYHRIGLDTDAEKSLRSEERQMVARYGARASEALCRLYAKVRSGERRYWIGQLAARPEWLDRAPTSGTRWLWECVYPKPFEPLVREVESRHSLPADLAYALIRQESSFRPGAVSDARAVGLMQLLPSTARLVARELDQGYEPPWLLSPYYNIQFGTFYLGKLLSLFARNLALAVAAYNAGPEVVSRWLKSGEQLPLDVFVAKIPYVETREHVSRVLGNYARYRYLEGGESEVIALDLELPHGLHPEPGVY